MANARQYESSAGMTGPTMPLLAIERMREDVATDKLRRGPSPEDRCRYRGNYLMRKKKRRIQFMMPVSAGSTLVTNMKCT